MTEVSPMTPRFEPGKVVSCREIKRWFSKSNCNLLKEQTIQFNRWQPPLV